MEVPQTDYNKANLRWSDRIHRENSVNAKLRSAGYECHRNPDRLELKINNLPPPSVRQKRIMEYLHNKEGYDRNNPVVIIDSLSPRTKFLLPQSTSQNLGWSLKPRTGTLVVNKPKNVLTGLYNQRRRSNVQEPTVGMSTENAVDHARGYITLLGEDSHPRKGIPRSLSVDPAADCVRGVPDDDSLGDLLDIADLPGDFHIRPHELKYRASKVPPGTLQVENVSHEPSEATGAVSIPTTVLRRVDSNLSKCIENQNEYMNGNTSNKWYRPLNSNDVSRYGDAYVKCMHCGPFNKSQLLVSR